MKVRSGALAISGSGKIYYDKRLDLRVRAGALGGITDTLGAVGDILKTVTDTMILYKVSGIVGAPVVTVSALNIGSSE
jgi:hypothetical protein